MRPFYGKEIDIETERSRIQKILSKYRGLPVTVELKKTIYDELSNAKEQGLITIPFKIAIKKSSSSNDCEYIEILLETKV